MVPLVGLVIHFTHKRLPEVVGCKPACARRALSGPSRREFVVDALGCNGVAISIRPSTTMDDAHATYNVQLLTPGHAA